MFARHHYLDSKLAKVAKRHCYLALVNDQPAAFTAVIHFAHPTKSSWREHPTVCLPDYQGVGIGNALSNFVASLYHATRKKYTSTTGNPAMIHYRAKSPLWKMHRKPSRASGSDRGFSKKEKRIVLAASDRFTAGFQYIGPPNYEAAKRFGLKVCEPKPPKQKWWK